jgi:hypothetical protein
MNLFCPLSKAVRFVLWLAVLSVLLGLVLGCQAGAAGNPADSGRPAATAPPDARN